MAMALPYLMVGIQAYGMYSTDEAADDQEDIARENADRQRMESEEAVRRLTKRQEQSESQAKAMAAASGVQVSGSIEDYLDIMQKTNKSEADWLKKSGLSAASIMQREGELQADMTRTQGRIGMANTFLASANQGNWFQSTPSDGF